MRNLKSVLLVEDDRIDALTARRAFADARIANPLSHCVNGEDALAYLRDPGKPRPCVILLDLNMPKMNGIEFLRIAKGDEDLRNIPVIVLTTSQEQSDIINSFAFGAAGYILKPIDYLEFVQAVRTIHLYWMLSELPEPVGRQ